MKVLLIAGARPNFMKIAPIYRQSLEYDKVQCKVVHTGQHYDYAMSQAFFDDLELPEPDYFLNAGSGSHAEQTAKIMVAFEREFHPGVQHCGQEDANPGGARGSRATELRPVHARRNQPHGDGRHFGLFFRYRGKRPQEPFD